MAHSLRLGGSSSKQQLCPQLVCLDLCGDGLAARPSDDRLGFASVSKQDGSEGSEDPDEDREDHGQDGLHGGSFYSRDNGPADHSARPSSWLG